jgi:ribosome-associated translation inhibitor RaiA
MSFRVTGKNVEVSEAFQGFVAEKLAVSSTNTTGAI